MATAFDELRALEHREIERLSSYLDRLDPAGWREQSYCRDWPVYAVVSHLASSSRIYLMRFDHWLDGGPPVELAQMQPVWDHFNAVPPEQMPAEFQAAVGDYLRRLDALPAATGQPSR